MRVLLAVLLSVVLLGAAPALAPRAVAAPIDRYVDPVNGWSISYPAGWRVDGSDPAVVLIHDPENQALVSVRVIATELPLNLVASQMMASQAQALQEKQLTWTITGRQLITLPNGTPAVDIRGDLVPGGRSHQLYFVRGGRAFGIDAETYIPFWDKFSADFDQILMSFALPPA